MRLPSNRAMRLCQLSAIARERSLRVLSTLRYSHCQARTSQFTTRDLRRAFMRRSCCLTNWITAKRMIATKDPHKRMDRISTQVGPRVKGVSVDLGKGGKGGGVGKRVDEEPPNKRKGRLNKS